MTVYDTKKHLFSQYCAELAQIQPGLPANANIIEENCDSYISSADCSWRNVYYEGELVGFLIIGKAGIEKHPDSDYAIAEAYILPGHRGMGLMTTAVQEYVETHAGTYSVLVLKDNVYAKHFWAKLFRNLGYHATPLNRDCLIDRDFVDLFGFAPD